MFRNLDSCLYAVSMFCILHFVFLHCSILPILHFMFFTSFRFGMADRMSLWTGLPQGYIQGYKLFLEILLMMIMIIAIVMITTLTLGYSPELVGLVEMMLHPNYRRRPTATLLVAEGTQKRQDEDF